MSTFTKTLRARWGDDMKRATANSSVPVSLLAGLARVENSQLNPDAKRFEPGVYEDLISLRDHGYCFVAGKKRVDYNGVRRDQIADANDEAIHALSTSYSWTQIMGYWVIRLGVTLADLRDPVKHWALAVRLLELDAGVWLRKGDWRAVLHIWNAGSPTAPTYDPDYVPNALAAKAQWEAEDHVA